jgi:hypothetical protein
VNVNEAERLQRHLAILLAEFAAGQGDGSPSAVLDAMIQVALGRVGGVSSTSVTTKTVRVFKTAASSDHTARAADHLQHELGHGPALEAIATRTPCHLRDAVHDRRWPELGAKLAAENVFSVLSVPLGQASSDGMKVVAASLNLYATSVGAFGPASVLIASLLAAHAGPSWTAAVSTSRIANLERGMATRSNIGPAIGLLMARYELGHDEASKLLRDISNRSNRKVADLATEIVEVRNLPASAKEYLRPSAPRAHRGRPRTR